MKRIAVVGAGGMARVRARALSAVGGAELCAVAARRRASAERFGAEMGCEGCFDDYRRLTELRPDAVLVEVPHQVQDEVVLWAVEQGLHVLVGGCLASGSTAAERIGEIADAKGLVVEAGYEARYSAVWTAARDKAQQGELGRLVAVRTIALWPGDPTTWYYRQHASGGMPLTHMTYCFINPLRWILGDVRCVSAFANRIVQTAPGMIDEETCVANLLFDHDVVCSATAGFVKGGALPAWSATFIGETASLEVKPTEAGGGSLVCYTADGPEPTTFESAPNPFETQAGAFLSSIDGPNTCRNTPADTLGDIRTAEAIVASARARQTVTL